MKRKIWLVLLMLAVMLLTACTKESSFGNKDDLNIPVTDASEFKYEYSSSLSGMVVTDYVGESLKVNIPDTLDGKPVLSVYLAGCEKPITHLAMPNSARFLEISGAIKGSLKYIKLSESLVGFGDSDFEGCKKLTSIKIPDSVIFMGGWVFKDCTELKMVTIPDGLKEIGPSCFTNCEKVQITYKGNTYYYEQVNDLYEDINGYGL